MLILFLSDEKCRPSNLPSVNYAQREVIQTSQGWHVTYTCLQESTPNGASAYMSYHYPDGTATYYCKQYSTFLPEKLISCQGMYYP